MALSFAVLKIRDFRLLLSGRICALMAMQAQAIIVGWQIYSLTNDPLMLGLVGLTEALPAIACALFAGHIVDNSKPYKIYLLCIGFLVINVFIVYLFAGGIISVPDSTKIKIIFAGVFFSGIVRSFVMPASFSLFPQIVPRDKFPAASAWMSSGFQFSAIIGPTIAGLVYGGYGVKIAWILPLILITITFILLLAIGNHPKTYKNSNKREATVKSIHAGIKFIFHNKIILSIMTLDMFAVLFGGAVSILPAFAAEVLHLGSEGLGLLRAAPALGAIITALILALKPMKNIKGSLLFFAVSAFGLCMLGFALSTSFIMAMFFLALSGVFDSISMIIRATLMQVLTPENMRGRVSSVNSMFIISSNEIGAFESGVAARLMGIVPSIIFGGAMTLVVVGAIAYVFPNLWKEKVKVD